MGYATPQALTNQFPQAGRTRITKVTKVICDLTAGADSVETPFPNDYLASSSPQVGGHVRSFRRDWLKEKCSNC